MKPDKKARLIRTYELHIKGKNYSKIAAVLANRKGNVSEDLASVEELAGQRIRAGNPYMGANASESSRRFDSNAYGCGISRVHYPVGVALF